MALLFWVILIVLAILLANLLNFIPLPNKETPLARPVLGTIRVKELAILGALLAHQAKSPISNAALGFSRYIANLSLIDSFKDSSLELISD